MCLLQFSTNYRYVIIGEYYAVLCVVSGLVTAAYRPPGTIGIPPRIQQD